uniref:Ig-like domain-containing protein n=1 Tax=Podarcis muralis TaxID=64176 RepID=A0A670JDV7_PODMU
DWWRLSPLLLHFPEKRETTWQLTGPVEVHGFEGQSLSLCCHYQQTYEDNTKSWCKMKEGLLLDSCETLISSDGKVNMGRVSLRENKKEHYFQVTMDNLHLNDSGVYRCVIDRPYLFSIRHRVNVTVSPGKCSSSSSSSSPCLGTMTTIFVDSFLFFCPLPPLTPLRSRRKVIIYRNTRIYHLRSKVYPRPRSYRVSIWVPFL